jgi:hypothetical protein
MVALALFIAAAQDDVKRVAAIYRCPAVEAESKFFEQCVGENEFDTYCVEPKAGPHAIAVAKGKVKFITAAVIDTKANQKWRNATIDFSNGKISPKAWLSATKTLRETVHCLSFPTGQKLRAATGEKSMRAVFAELFSCSLPGRPCFTADDIWQTRYFPGPGRLESWILAMNDYLGPMLSYRHDRPYLQSGKPMIIRADAKPGLLIFRQGTGANTMTFYLNNGPAIPLPPISMDHVTINIGIDMEGPKPILNTNGFLIVDDSK